MGKLIHKDVIDEIILLRKNGSSVPEISLKLGIAKGTTLKYVKGVEVDPEFKTEWLGKWGGSRRRMISQWNEAKLKSSTLFSYDLNLREKTLILASLYWSEGSKKDFNFMNSDPQMIGVFITLVQEVLGVNISRIRPSIRIHSGEDEPDFKKFWGKITGVNINDFGRTEVVEGRKTGKLKFGMCRVRVLKGGILLKYLVSVWKGYSSIISPHSSMDRAKVS